MNKDEMGRMGEEIALNYLLSKGMKLIEKNIRVNRGEIDLILAHHEEIVFVEVKTRANAYLGEPWRMVGKSKQRQLIKTADAYIRNHNIDQEARFDIVSIICNDQKQQIEHIPFAFRP
jgi:putative endonuclease